MMTLLTKYKKNSILIQLRAEMTQVWGVLQNVTMTPHWTVWLPAKSCRRTGAHVTSLTSLYIPINME